MKGDIFIDTSAWFALIYANDINHLKAKAFLPMALSEYRMLVSTNHVIGETYTLIRYRLGYAIAWQFLKNIWRSRRLNYVFISETQERQSYALLERYPDQTFSFVDGTSFTVMKLENISDCFAFDRHFAVAGFTALPVSS